MLHRFMWCYMFRKSTDCACIENSQCLANFSFTDTTLFLQCWTLEMSTDWERLYECHVAKTIAYNLIFELLRNYWNINYSPMKIVLIRFLIKWLIIIHKSCISFIQLQMMFCHLIWFMSIDVSSRSDISALLTLRV